YLNLNYFPELSPEKSTDVKDASLKTVLRYVYMYDKNTQNKIDAVAIVFDYSSKEFLFNYLRDRYMVVSDNDEEEQEFKSIDENVFVKTKAIDEQSRDKNYNYSVFVEDAYIVAMFVPNNGEESNDALFKELEKGVMESYLRDTYSVSITVNTEEAGSISVKNIKGIDLTEGQMIQYGKIILSATANEGYKFAGWFKHNSNGLSAVSYQIKDTISVESKIEYVAVFDKPFEVKVLSSDGGSAKISTAIEVDKTILNVTKYEPVTFKAEAAEGYQFVNWTDAEGNVIETNAEFVKTLEGAVEYQANFEVATCNIEVILEGEGIIEGDIINGEETIKMIFAESSLKGTAKYGQKIKLTATEKEGSEYIFAGWKQDKKIVSTQKQYEISAIQDIQMTALFKKKEFKVAVEAGEGGTVTPTTKNVESGSTIKIEAKPNKGYQFVNWTANGEEVSTENPFEPVITQDSTFKAIFEKMSYNVSIAVKGEGKVSAYTIKDDEETEILSDGTDNIIDFGDTIKLKVTEVPESSIFVGWELNNQIVSKETEYVTTISNNSLYTAKFEKKAYYIKILAGEGGTIKGNDHPRVIYGETLTLTASANDGYVFVNWTVNGEIVSTDAEFTTEPIYSNINFKANCEKVKYNVEVVAGEGGTVSPEEKQEVTNGGQITITATAAEGYRFVNWSVGDEVVSNSNPYTTAPITEDKTYKANFEKL
ncbi:MAG: InlB B-repeat-containing protein, partial [Bacteroidales bacterium]|nr:InlB B-repeat-containing protein [Bacteroidales bacterium]